jgi:hypothetical protein
MKTDFIRSNGYAWPSGYPCALLMVDGEVIDSLSARRDYLPEGVEL